MVSRVRRGDWDNTSYRRFICLHAYKALMSRAVDPDGVDPDPSFQKNPDPNPTLEKSDPDATLEK